MQGDRPEETRQALEGSVLVDLAEHGLERERLPRIDASPDLLEVLDLLT
jgi:hypothetical protein